MSPAGETGCFDAWPFELKEVLESEADGFFTVLPMRSVDSTNEELKRRIRSLKDGEELPEGLTAAAAEQTAGKGRLGRTWESPMGESAYFSFLLRPSVPVENISMLTLLMGLSVAEAVNGLYHAGASIKWPNDVVIGSKKICGILTEAFFRKGTDIPYVIVGTGINVNNPSFDGELKDKALSLRMFLNEEVSPARITASVLRRFAFNYQHFLEKRDLHTVKDRYNAILVNKERDVRVEDPAGPYTGIARGIDDFGRLAVDRAGEDGRSERVYISSGEVSVRGLYGYV
ncbi:MAG: biotin--[acetyl-CoA-carboxylase] ligase [Lachnospiraceae bacterium]|nr:biotin--[acetyl-CoA-carboxylase] ligase [Lachnospiraceae bacterium]